MGWQGWLEGNATRLGEHARKTAPSAPVQQMSEGLRDLRAMLAEDDEQSLSIERFLLALVRAVRNEGQGEEHAARDVYVTARKRRRRLGLMSFGAGPLVGVANQLADLFCETATVCDVAALHGKSLSDEQIGAHMLVLWGVVDDQDAAQNAMAGKPPVASIVAGKLRERAVGQLPETLTKRSATKALWDVRGTIGDTGRGATTGAIRTVAFTGHRTKKVIKKAEAQLGVSPHPSPRWSLR
jgi:hypothetical protein